MEKIVTTLKKSKPIFNLAEYVTESHLEGYQKELEEETNPYFKGFSADKSKYTKRGGGKSGNTELRVVGVLLNMLEARRTAGRRDCKVKFQLADIARQIVSEKGVEISTRTVSRYLSLVLDKLAEQFDIHWELLNGQAGFYRMWTAEHEALETSHSDFFDPHLADRAGRKKEKETANKVRQFSTTKRDLGLMPKAKGNKNLQTERRKPSAKLAKIARFLLKEINLPVSSRFQIEDKSLHLACWRALETGYWRDDIKKAALKAHRITDQATSDFQIHSPTAYFLGSFKKVLSSANKPSKQELNEERRRFWRAEAKKVKKIAEEMKAAGFDPSPEAEQQARDYFADKLKKIQ